MERIIYVTNREERDAMFRVLREMGYELIECGYHYDTFQRADGVIRKIIDVRP